MKPAAFEYYAPVSVEEALDLLDQLGYDGKILAGGQSLIPAMNFRMAQPHALVDLNRVKELFYIKSAPDGSLLIGAMTRDVTVEFDKMVAERLPVVTETMPLVGYYQNRTRGTYGGNLAHADPTGQLPTISVALGARAHIRSKTGERWVEMDDFYLGPFTTILEPQEMLVEVAYPALPPRSAASFKEFTRQVGATPMVGVAVLVTLDDKNRFKNAKIAYLGVGEKPYAATECVKVLLGQEATAEAIRAAAETAAQKDVDPGTDIHGTADYRRNLVNVLTRKALTQAVQSAKK
ncbi:MAG: xanthine dehydrogenase family protein subunit M [Anaerolineae bacterium]|nr:xanthine dehydrogenase family protein subunit M [Anaerolineae bacterium]